MNKVLALAVALAAIAAGYGFYLWYPGGPTQLRIATEGAYPPFNAIDKDGNLVGFDVDIANALCDHMNASCTIEAQAWDGIIPGLLDRKYDAIVASMSITEKRREQVNFTDKYYSSSARFVAKKGAKIEISDAGLAGKRVGVQRATVYEAYLRAKFPHAVPVLYDTQENANADIAADNRLERARAQGARRVRLRRAPRAGRRAASSPPQKPARRSRHSGRRRGHRRAQGGCGLAVRPQQGIEGDPRRRNLQAPER